MFELYETDEEWEILPDTYRGVHVPDYYRFAFGDARIEAFAWRRGVDSAKGDN